MGDIAFRTRCRMWKTNIYWHEIGGSCTSPAGVAPTLLLGKIEEEGDDSHAKQHFPDFIWYNEGVEVAAQSWRAGNQPGKQLPS